MHTTRRTNPQSLKRDSTNILRASVFDVFVELGAMEENSKVAEWILNEVDDQSVPSTASTSFDTCRTGEDGVAVPRKGSGSRFVERFDSFILPNLEDETARHRSRATKSGRLTFRTSRFLDRLRTPRSKKSVSGAMLSRDDGDVPHHFKPKKNHSIIRFKSAANLRRRDIGVGQQLTPPTRIVPVRAGSVGIYTEEPKPIRRSLFRNHTQPVPTSTPASVPSGSPSPIPMSTTSQTSEEWETMSAPTTADLNTVAGSNPFVRGEVHFQDIAPIKPPRQTDNIFRSFEDIISHTRKRSNSDSTVFARRAQSHPEPLRIYDSMATTARRFSSN